ncbi:replicative DNA helicase [Paenibacillus macquariensis]|uniref:Replicative DNA helicase n=1 Tax=Paenibacillus macquariensis TaxID=948756 RepID=A0ABY1KEX4_9BACL|nr:replicative DNA helicase [Paenibacillus macquariensis]MEC0092479.1 replicative DNA helicase [Paenibacillus macquariensis]OAB35437.1 hypothetical protein PMSM_09275 [Paenibacillus macquariensis subsp. macquariensis]SIR72621.1 replicative DNA helicase [Paenibacillus macquariensis]
MSYYSIEAEQAVLGAILISPDLIYETTAVEDDFYYEPNQIIYKSMIQLKEEEKKVDVVSLSSNLGEELHVIGGIKYLVELSQSVPSISDFGSYERIVKEKFVIRHGMESIKKIYSNGNDNPKEFISELVGVTEELSDRFRTDDGFTHIGEGLIEHSEILQDKKYGSKPLGVSTVGTDLDLITGKWQNQTLNILAARPSVGKTAAMLNNAVKNGKEGMTVAIFSLEQPKQQLLDRMISAECNIDGSRIKSGQLHDEEWVKYTIGLSILSELNIYIDDRPGLSIQEIRASVRKLKKNNPELIVYIDYLQLINGGKSYTNRNRNDEVGYVSNSLKQMSRENDCPVIALAQLSRGVEQRQDKRPMMSDLRESGNIEQDADTISFLYRDDYYNAGTDKKNIIEIIVAKNREGQTGTAEMVNLRNYSKFLDYDYRPTR